MYRQRRTPQNPLGHPLNSWNYRICQLRHALGWTRSKLAQVMGVDIRTVSELDKGQTQRPDIDTIRKIRSLEKIYEDVIKEYKKAPIQMDRLKSHRGHAGVKLLPIAIRRPSDIETLGEMESDSESTYFGRASRRRMQNIGMSMRRKAYLRRKREAISQGLRAKIATGWRPGPRNKKVESGQSNGEGGGEGRLD